MFKSLKSISVLSKKNIFENTLLSRSLECSRNFCSKDEISNKNSKTDSSEEKLEKVAEEDIKSKTQLKSEAFSDDSKEAAKQKLMSLLSEIKISSGKQVKTTSTLNLAKAVKRISKKERLEEMKLAQLENSPEGKMNKAVKAVASAFKEDSQKVESELTEKLKSLKDAEEIVSETTKATLVDSEAGENLISSVEEVAATVTERPIPARSELTQRLLRLSLEQKDSQDVSETKKSVLSVISKMKVQPRPNLFRKMKPVEKIKPVDKSPSISKVNLFGSHSLGIFSPDASTKPDSRNMLWQKLQEKELYLLTQFAPANAFEEMILWTEQGKHWTFPIDNEIDMGAEENVGFHEHVFLDHHLKGFPTKGPIRHFMELVVVGLSKNPYITVERKIENIEWFRNYFKEKEEILKECGAI